MKIDEIKEKELQKSEFKTSDIPDLNLYMDQILTLFDTVLKDHKRNEEDKLMTKTMINNYSKAKVIKPIKGKKYSKQQIIQLLDVYTLKNALSIEDIKQVLRITHDDPELLESSYNQYIKLNTNTKKELSSFIDNSLVNLNIDDAKDRITTLLLLSSTINILQNMMEDIIEED